MKISNNVGPSLSGLDKTQTDKVQTDKVSLKSGQPGKKSVTPSELGSSARVNLSESVRDMAKIKELATPKADDVNMQKVDRLQKLIDKGEYKVEAQAIADRMVDEHMMFPS